MVLSNVDEHLSNIDKPSLNVDSGGTMSGNVRKCETGPTTPFHSRFFGKDTPFHSQRSATCVNFEAPFNKKS